MPRPDRHHIAQSGTARRRVVVGWLVTLCCSHAAFARSVTISPADPKRWDVAGSIGWLAGNKSDIAEEWNDWYDTFATSLEIGRYWTPHVKTEAGVIVTTEAGVFARQQPFIPDGGSPIFIPREHHFRVTAFSAFATYQFFENTVVHPFLGAGVDLNWEHERSETPEQIVPTRDPRVTTVLPAEEDVTDTRFTARPFVTAGFKAYFSERGFFRSDIKTSFGDGRAAHVVWRAGIGVDF